MASASQIDPTVFPDNQKVDKADLRTQFTIAANEITSLELKVSVPRKMAYDDTQFDNL